VTADPTLITGVGKRAGFHIARVFLQRGMPVVGTYRTWYPRLEELERLGADLLHCDFDRQDEVERLINDIGPGTNGYAALSTTPRTGSAKMMTSLSTRSSKR
jgi:NAD(P)-dependent dehydrogenase (short-subunit alcohol dehydrogenase family)